VFLRDGYELIVLFFVIVHELDITKLHWFQALNKRGTTLI